MSASVSALLNNPRFGSVYRLAGSGDPVVTVVGALTAEATKSAAAISAAVGSGSVLVILDRIDTGEWTFDALLRRAVATGCQVVAVAEPAVDDSNLTLLADRLGVVVLAVTDPWRFGVELRDLLSNSRSVMADAVLRATHAGQRAGLTVENLLSVLLNTFQRPFLVLDAAGRPLIGADVFTENDRLVAGSLSDRSAPTTLELDSGGVLIACPVMSGGVREPWLAVVLPVRQSVEEASLAVVLDVASLAVGHRLAVARMIDEREARRRSALLSELVDTTGDATPGLLRRALDAGWALDGWHIGIKVLTVADVDLVARRSEVAEALAAEGITANVVEQADGWASWTTLPGEPRPESITRLAESIRAAQDRLDPTMDTWFGVGRAHEGPAGIGISLSEAGDAARLAGSRSQTGRFLHVDRLGLAQLLLAWTRTDTFQPAAAALLAPLRAAGGELLDTLSTYLDEESSLAHTATRMGLHRNTVSSRIERIQRLLSVDLGDPETRLALHLACRTVRE
ncbi:purine catabolism regulator [Rhodococcus sp. 27YEA15]|uniref:PucR family transcriptional regulator n=1 Tax=Rhodococcus sp. 27YEA15 TaxID=3156259 RepID=UPI003C7DCFD4